VPDSPQPEGFDLLYEEGPCLVVAKPGGVLTQAVPGVDSLEVRVRAFLRRRDAIQGNFYLAHLHRLDRPVSGALVLARHVRAAKRIGQQFERRPVRKTYWAVVEGVVEPASGTWLDHVRKIPDVAQAEVVPPDHPEGRHAVLHYRTLRQFDGMTWLEIELETGRTHQIRVQAASRGYPVLGDAQYGAKLPFGPQTADERERWIALHARSLELAHPMTRERFTVVAPLPEPWQPLKLPNIE
jgi:23S rRNA pseudouridine1911/1915/1917 synthase